MIFRVLVAAFVLGVAVPDAIAQVRSRYSFAAFAAEVTPPVGHPLQAGVGVKPVVRVEDPLFAHGFVLLGDEGPVVLVSVDWCGIGNDAHDYWRRALAEAAGTKPERVLVCAIHQHDAPLADLEAERMIEAHKLGRGTLDVNFHAKAVQRVVAALKRSLKDARPLTHIGVGQAKVEMVASNRRVLGLDGKVAFVRGSSSKDPRAQEAPEGVIDPWLKTISFWNGDKALASLSVYATHPMSHYGQGNVSSDFTGLARRIRQGEDPGVLHFYANGCGGNLGAGKYNNGDPEARVQLTERLHKAWQLAWKDSKRHPIDKIGFRSTPLHLEPRNTAGFRVLDLETILTGAKSTFDERVRAAYGLSWRKRCDAKKPLDIPVIDFGKAQLLLLPGEPFVEYQHFAQKQRPDLFVVTLGYGDYGPVYIPTDKAYDEGGYEPGAWSFVGPGVEKRFKEAIAKALGEPVPASARDGNPLFQASAKVEFGEDLGQDFGTLFEVRDEKGRVILGAGFPSIFNTCVRLDRFALQFYVRPTNSAKAEKTLLPRPSPIAHQSLQDYNGQLYSWTYHLDKTVRRWDAPAKQWREDSILDKNKNVFGDGFMQVAGKPLVYQDSQAWYDGKLILSRPEVGSYTTFYYAHGRLFFYHILRADKGAFTNVLAAPWKPGQARVDLGAATILKSKVAGETTFTWGQLGPKVLTVSNYGNVYVFDGSSWQEVRDNEPGKSYQVYSAVNYHGDLLLGHYPTGRLLRYDGKAIVEMKDSPPVMPGVAGYSREAQSTMLYRGDLYVGVWPWAELWRYDRDTKVWTLTGRMFTRPELTDKFGHPFQKEIQEYLQSKKADLAINDWGQRVCSLAPWHDALMIATSAKGPMAQNRQLAFLTDDVYAEYGRVWQFRSPGHLSVPVAYRKNGTRIQCVLHRDGLEVLQDGKQIGTTAIEPELLAKLRPAAITWADGMYGRSACKLSEKASTAP